MPRTSTRLAPILALALLALLSLLSSRASAAPLLTGFLDADGNARGRPVGVAFDSRGGLLIADDVGNAIWRVVGSQTLTKGR